MSITNLAAAFCKNCLSLQSIVFMGTSLHLTSGRNGNFVQMERLFPFQPDGTKKM